MALYNKSRNMNDRYLTAVIRVPIRLTLEGGLTMMNECSKITIEKMDEDELFTKTGDTVFSKVVEYLERELGGEEGSLQDEPLEDKPLEDKPLSDKPLLDKPLEGKPLEDEPLDDKPLSDKPLEDEPLSDKSLEEDAQKARELEPKEIKFTYFKKSKKPMNVTFRERNKSQNFTKKVYSP